MKKWSIIPLIIMITLVLTSVICFANEVVVNENFENGIQDTSSWTLKCIGTDVGTVGCTTIDGTPYLQVHKTQSQTGSVTSAQKITNRSLTGLVKLEIDVKTESTAGYRTIQVRDSSNNTLCTWQFYNTNFSDRTGTEIKGDSNVDGNMIHNIVAYFRTSTKKYDMYYDGKLMVKDHAFLYGVNVSSVLFHIDSNQTGSLYVKNLHLEIMDDKPFVLGKPYFEDENGNKLINLKDGITTGKVTVNNDLLNIRHITLILCYYKGYDLETIQMKNATLMPGDDIVIPCNIECTDTQNGVLKAYVWDNLTDANYLDKEVVTLNP